MTSIHFCSSDSWGGLELYAATLMIELNKAGVNVIAVTKPNSKIHQFLSARGIQCEFLPGYGKIDIGAVKTVQLLIKRYKVQVVHVHFHSDVWIASIAVRKDRRTKLYLSIYMGVGKKRDIFHRWIYSRVDGIFSSSLDLNSRLHTLYPVNKEKIHYLPYGRIVDDYVIDSTKREEIRTRHRINPDDLVAGTMVRIDTGKGVIDFIKSFMYLSEADRTKLKFLIVGEPTRKATQVTGESPFESHSENYYREMIDYVNRNNLSEKIIFTGYQDDTIGYLSAMDIFVFPSRDELYSLVVLDAMCMHLPVVAARAGGNLKQITDGVNGMLFNVADSSDLAAKLTCYIASPVLRQEHGNAARRFVEKEHSMKQIVNRLMLFYG
ncbi:MAG: glycosyltransferase family 4 protein [Bacteroidota bacterium]